MFFLVGDLIAIFPARPNLENIPEQNSGRFTYDYCRKLFFAPISQLI
jgi:hypothetical protein